MLSRRESAAEHLRNALQLLRVTMESGEVAWPGLVVPVSALAGIQARLEAALDELEPRREIRFPQEEP